MFLGEYQHVLDAKGRVSLPAKFRTQLTGKVVVAMGLDHSLYVFPPEEHDKFMAELLEKDEFDSTVRQVQRFFTSGGDDTDIDSAGRISLAGNLREWADLKKEVRVIGMGRRIEIWDAETWNRYNGETSANIEALSQDIRRASGPS